MSYSRGKFYIWVGTTDKGEEDIFLWVANDPDDNRSTLMEGSIWADEMKQSTIPLGTFMPLSEFDQIVVMRMAELIEEGIAEKTEKKAIKTKGGNIGCDALCKKYKKPTALDRLNKKLKE